MSNQPSFTITQLFWDIGAPMLVFDTKCTPAIRNHVCEKNLDKDKLLHVGLDVDEAGDTFDAVSHAAAFEQVATKIGVEAARSAQQRKLNWQKNMYLGAVF